MYAGWNVYFCIGWSSKSENARGACMQYGQHRVRYRHKLAYNCGDSGEDESESLDPRLAVLSHLVEIKGNKIPK